MAYRVDHKTAIIPPPSATLFGKMAVAGYDAARDSSEKCRDVPFVRQPVEIQEVWIAAARAMYGIVAVMGGGKPITIKEPE
jgi:hypothetical protein